MNTKTAQRNGRKALDQWSAIVDRPSGNTPSRSSLPERSERDFQQGKLYASEDLMWRMLERQHEFPLVTIAGSRITVPLERKFGTLEQIQEYVDTITVQAWPGYKRMQGNHVEVVRTRPGRASYRTGKIYVPDAAVGPNLRRWAMRQCLVLHELSHHYAPGGHGPEFVAAYRMLVTDQMGPEAGLMFNVLMNEGGVKG